MERSSDGTVMISDLSIATPKSAVTDIPKEGCWLKASYELVDGTKGVMLTADPNFKAAEIEIPLNVSGVYRIFIGMGYFMQPYEVGRSSDPKGYGSLWAKLPGDKGFSRFGHEKYDSSVKRDYPSKKFTKTNITEVYWRTADLTGKNLTVCLPKAPYDSEFYREVGNISFIKLEPATTEDLELMEDLSHSTKNMAAIWCAGALTGHTRGHYMYHPVSSQWFDDEFQSYRNSDFGIFCMEAMRGNLCLFKTKHGDVGTLDRSWGADWVDPLTEFTRVAHDAGMKIFANIRMIGGGRPYAFNPVNWARFFWDNPQWSRRDKEGNRCANVSLAYEGVRQHWLSLLREALDHGIDGLTLYLNKSAPFVMYEEPVVESFMEKHGIDPRKLPEDDERWQRHVAGYVTQYVREVRALVNEKPGRELAIMFKFDILRVPRVEATGFNPGTIFNGCDPDTWIEEGLIDYLFLTSSATSEHRKYWKELGEGRVKIYPRLDPRQQPGDEYAKLAESLYEDGADGFCVWDSERRMQRSSEVNVFKHLGHRNRLKYFMGKAPDYYRTNEIKFSRGLNVRYSYTDG